DRIMAIFTNEADATAFGEDPEGYIDENLPEGVEPGDIASCMPQVAENLGGSYAGNLAGYNSAAAAATPTVATEIAYTYNTTYQQNTFIYAEEGSQVTNIQGDGNAVSQQQIDADFQIGDDYGSGEPEPEGGYTPEEQPVEADAPNGEAPYEPEDEYKPENEPEHEETPDLPEPVIADHGDGGYEPEPEPEPAPEPMDGME
ncbi:hypothetical protein B7486_57595, partial [cyanobacterium TDX16]